LLEKNPGQALIDMRLDGQQKRMPPALINSFLEIAHPPSS
jgi:hypothetical protein